MATTIRGEDNFDTDPDKVGKVLQVVSADFTGRAVTNSENYISTGFGLSITPKKSNSTLIIELTSAGASYSSVSVLGLIFACSDGRYSPLGVGGYGNINNPDGATQSMYTGPDGSNNNHAVPFSMKWVDSSHNTTNAVNYTLLFASNSVGAPVTVGGMGDNDAYGVVTTMTIMEVAA